MGTFYTQIGIANPQGGDVHWVDVLVNPEVMHAVFPASFLENTLGLAPKEYRNFVSPEGVRRELGIGEAKATVKDMTMTVQTVFAPVDEPIMGWLALMCFGLEADTVNERLVPAKLHLCAHPIGPAVGAG